MKIIDCFLYCRLRISLEHNLIYCLSLHRIENQASTQVDGRGFNRKHKDFPRNSHSPRCQTRRTQIENIHLLDCITVAMETRSDSRQTGGNWSSSFSLWCQTEGRTVNRVLLLPQRVDRGSQRAVLQPCANLILDAGM